MKASNSRTLLKTAKNNRGPIVIYYGPRDNAKSVVLIQVCLNQIYKPSA